MRTFDAMSEQAISDRDAKRVQGRSRLFLIVVGLVAIAQLALSLTAVSGKSPTADEPLHVYGGWRSVKYFDLRFNPEHPPLWKYWAALPSRGLTLGPADAPEYHKITEDVTNEWAPTVHDLYRVDAKQGLALIWRGRCMMAVLACAFTIAAACLGRYLGGEIAGMIAAAVVGLDPNTLAHGPLVTNDVPIALMFILVALVLAKLCVRVTWGRVATLGLLLGIAMGVKFTAVLLGPITAVCLLIRALFGSPWEWQTRRIASRVARLGVAVGVVAMCAVYVYALMWAMYGFRESVTPDGQRFSRHNFESELRWFQTHAQFYPRTPTNADLNAYQPGLAARALLACDSARLLPNAWTFGMTYAVARAGIRSAYLLGENSEKGWWYYFPIAMAFKTPTASLIALVGVGVAGCVFGRQWWRGLDERRRWVLVCIAVAVAIYAGQTMGSNLNIGFRHFFPVYYLLLIVTAVVVAHWIRTMKAVRYVGAALGVGLITSVVWSFPNYIPYFNLPSLAVGRPIDLLGDSNLDWGQDLPLIAQWQREHPGVKVYLSYFGTCDPEVYGIRATPVYPQYHYGPPGEDMIEPGVLMMSATRAQAILVPDFRERSKVMRQLPIRETIGESIMVYDAPPKLGFKLSQ